MMLLTLAACGGSEDTDTSASTASSTVSIAAVSQPEEDEEEPADQEAMDLTGWNCYVSMMEDESTIYYAFNVDGTRGAMIVLSSDATKSVSMIGDCAVDADAGIETITDDATSLTLTCGVLSETSDGGLHLSFGEYGEAAIYGADPTEMLAILEAIENNTANVTADFIASLQ